ncbi:MAG: LLM class flavin-dependent oxidoreductase [Proteobacteria bacterium]|nr:LLM class flavin-dependent oxidoreductase [Pseudomonadota bacterium]
MQELSDGSLERRRTLLTRAADAGIDHAFFADHVCFHGGTGMDGLIQAALAAALEPRLRVVVGVYLLALRHPVPVARQIASLCEAAPGRLVLGVGVGGEDRHEIEVCGVDPATRGRRTDACLKVLRPLLRGDTVDCDNEFFRFEAARIRPTPSPPVPIWIGGRSPAALRRAARFGDGWLGVWCSAKRFGQAVDEIASLASQSSRDPVARQHGLQLWVGLDSDRDRARERLAQAMGRLYRLPFEPFERYSPCGSADRIADFLAAYAEAGCRAFNVMAVASGPEAAVDGVAEIRERLLERAG